MATLTNASPALVELHLSRILTLATRLYVSRNGPYGGTYANLMMALPEAFTQWATETRQYEVQWSTPADEVESSINWIKHELIIAFQFPLDFIK